ncbi:hypothetical protein, partial [Fulvivirga aurantia]|uniref:hypothetical protein n=1 Tax=Fulvivirga aurantia TaxID=2529383 RepID=UPI00162421C7
DDFFVEVDDGSCTNVASITFTVNPLPIPTFVSGSSNVCFGDTETYITQTSQSNYTWNVNGGSIVPGTGESTDPSVSVVWDGTSPYEVSVNYEDANGCTAVTPTVLTVNVNSNTITTPLPTVEVCN